MVKFENRLAFTGTKSRNMEQLYKINKISNNSYSSVRYTSIIKDIVSEHIVPAHHTSILG